ncbi:MAG: type I-F CRISPR-associated endoribonuclease Cas6/Csy4 [Methyloprofundus sp.]|nr:type I-F CRISPR-associated endoribonuclease Cas6/Csy4 [Methyloprofundus sp.]
MKYYIDITLLPDAEANLGFLWQKVYQQLHLALVENKVSEKQSAIAVSIPDYGSKAFPLGCKLRLFAQYQEQLQQLDMGKWLKRLTDYTHVTSIKNVPVSVSQFAQFRRKQFNTNSERLARRRVKRKEESLEQALKHYASFTDQETHLPFINIKSLTKGEQFRLFIERDIFKKSEEGTFNCYGLSQGATVPIF